MLSCPVSPSRIVGGPLWISRGCAKHSAYHVRCGLAKLGVFILGASVGLVTPVFGQPVMRDSAGIRLIDNARDAADRQVGPILDVSRMRTFNGLIQSRMTAARLLQGDRLVLTDDGAHQLVFLDLRSGSRTIAGREGDGPEEFRSFRGLWRCGGDTLVVRSGLADLKVFDSRGRFVRARTASVLRGGVYGSSADCSVVVVRRTEQSGAVGAAPRGTLEWYDIETNANVAIASISAQERQVIAYLGGSAAVVVPFTGMPVIATRRDQVLVARTDIPEIRVYGRRGSLERIIRWSAIPDPLTAADRNQYETLRLRLDTLIRRGTTAQTPSLEQFDLPATKPLFVQLLVDDEGFIWVRKYPKLWDGFERIDETLNAFESEWWLFAPSGELLGTLGLPQGLAVKDISRRTVVGVHPDTMGILQVLVAPIQAEALRTRKLPR